MFPDLLSSEADLGKGRDMSSVSIVDLFGMSSAKHVQIMARMNMSGLSSTWFHLANGLNGAQRVILYHVYDL